MSLTRRRALAALSSPLISRLRADEELPDLSSIPTDLTVPVTIDGEPAAGVRVRQSGGDYAGTAVHHTLYLPTDWKPGGRYPIIVEYAGNGNYKNQFGDVSTGEVEGSKLGFGVSAGKGFIWLCLPYVNSQEKKNQIIWWGDVEATLRYAQVTVGRTCSDYGGDASAVILAGFSRGAIGCNYLGLHTDEIAKLWRAFLPYSHYDGVVTTWPYAGADRASALQRLGRLKGRPVFVCQEKSVDASRAYIEATGVQAPFTFQKIAFRNHNDAWALRDIPERRAARKWLLQVL